MFGKPSRGGKGLAAMLHASLLHQGTNQRKENKTKEKKSYYSIYQSPFYILDSCWFYSIN